MRTVASISAGKPRRMRSSSRLPTAASCSASRARSSASRSSPPASQKRARNNSTSSRGRLRVGAEHVVLVRSGECRRNDAPVAAVGAQDDDVVARGPRARRAVERVRLAAPAPDRRDGLGQPLAVALAVELGVVDEDAEIVQVGAVVTAVETRRHLLHDRQARGLEHGRSSPSGILPPSARHRTRVNGRAPACVCDGSSFCRPTANGSPAATRSSSSMSRSASSGEVAVL